MQDLNDLYFYAQVVDHGGFAAAARALGEPKSKLSRRVARLEERLQVRLIQRSTRRLTVTEIGQVYYNYCKAMQVPRQQHIWQLIGPGGGEARIAHQPRYITRDMSALRTAATAGVGVVQLPAMMVRDELDRGDLIHLLPGWAPKAEIIHAVFPSRRGLLPSVRSLVVFLAARFREIDEE